MFVTINTMVFPRGIFQICIINPDVFLSCFVFYLPSLLHILCTCHTFLFFSTPEESQNQIALHAHFDWPVRSLINKSLVQSIRFQYLSSRDTHHEAFPLLGNLYNLLIRKIFFVPFAYKYVKQ